MKVFIATIESNAWNLDLAEGFHALAKLDRVGKHEITKNPTEADIILFVDLQQHPHDWRLSKLQKHDLVRKYPNRIFVYDERDLTYCCYPGIYVSMPNSGFESKRQRAYSYWFIKNELMTPSLQEPDLLFSFQGGTSHPTRHEILKLKYPRAFVENPNLNFFDFSDYSQSLEYQEKVNDQKEKYRATIARSKFVLCPRGKGTSSFRLYETMAAGRVPVIISDEWVAPQGPDWDSCSIRVPESDIATIPALLEAKESQFASMAVEARKTFETWFAGDVIFHHLTECCIDLQREGMTGQKPFYYFNRFYLNSGFLYYKFLIRSKIIGSWVGEKIKRVVKR